MKRWVALGMMLALLNGCAAQRTDTRAESLQRRYADLTQYTARVSVSMVRENENRNYALTVSHTADGTRVTVQEPEALAGVSAFVAADDALTLEYDGTVLEAGSIAPQVNAVNAADILLRAVAEGWVCERSYERWSGEDALRLCFETERDGEKLLVTAWFRADDAPVYAEIERDGEILAYLEFTEFQFGDILSAD